MIKKKLIILLVTLLLVLLLGLSSSCYAYEHILTDEDIDIICDNNFGADTTYSNLFKVKMKEIVNNLQSMYDLVIINMQSSSYNSVEIYGTLVSRVVGVNYLNDKNYMQIETNGTCLRRVIQQNGYNNLRVDYYSTSGVIPVGSGAQNRSNYLLYTNDLGSSAIGPYQNLSWLQFTPPKIYEIDLNTVSTTQYFSITTDSNETISNIPVLYDNSFGEFLDDTYMAYWYYGLDFWYWTGSQWSNKLIFAKVSNSGDVRLKTNDYMNFVYYNLPDRTYEEVGLTVKDLYAFKNVVFHFQVINGNNDSADGYFLLGDTNTVISNGTLDTSSLPNDYLNQFDNLNQMINDNNNTLNIITDLNDFSQFDEILNNNISGDYLGFANELGYKYNFNSGDYFIMAFVNNLCATLMDDDDVYFDYSMHR